MTRFLLATVQLDVVLHAEYPSAMRAQLGDLPKTPSESYMKALERIRLAAKDPKLGAIHALGWLFYAKAKLQIKELLDAVRLTTKLAYDFDPSDLTDMCRGLVRYDKPSGIVEFIHGTVEIFLNSCFSPKATMGIDDLRPYFLSDVDMAKACLTYLSSNVFNDPCTNDESLENRLRQYNFSGYAACYWAYTTSTVKFNFHRCSVPEGPKGLHRDAVRKFLTLAEMTTTGIHPSVIHANVEHNERL
jgi:hypothetical protein